MSKILYAALLLGMMITAPTSVRAADEPAVAQKEKDVRKFLEVSGAGKMGQQMMDAVVGQMRKVYPQVPQEFWGQFSKEADFNDLLELIVPIYEKHFSDAEILDLIKFYESPIGRKLVQEQPVMLQESMQIGQKWGQELATKIVKRMSDQGYLKS